MPKISELPEVTETNSSGYVVGVQDDTAVKYPLSLIGNGGSSIVSPGGEGTSIYTGTEPPASPTDGQLWIDESQGIQDYNNYLNISAFTTDYPLRRGETAIVNYTSTSSVPLHIKTVEGIYEMEIHYSAGATSTTAVTLSMNNTTTSAIYQIYNGTTTTGGTVFELSKGTTYSGYYKICTMTAAKTIVASGVVWNGSPNIAVIDMKALADNATVWSSLGTITFPNAQSGTILIRRIY